MNIGNLSLAVETARFLKPKQLLHQFRRRLLPPGLLTKAPAPPPFVPVALAPFPSRPASFLGSGHFRFLNRVAALGPDPEWTCPALPRLWQYHLHYFDFLLQDGLSFSDGHNLIHSWIKAHSPTRDAVGWEPYPTSIRVVNWLKFYARHLRTPGPDVLASLALQGANLTRRLEFHLLGNHLFENAKALGFLGLFLRQTRWTKLGSEITGRQLHEQFLPDGGHIELSPMYHCAMLEGLLDLANLHQGAGLPVPPRLAATARRSLTWLNSILRAGQQIPLLNDSAYNSAPDPRFLLVYASSLRVDPLSAPSTRQFGSWTAQVLSGYWVARHPSFALWFDAAPLGPDFLPGHAHGDMLSILLDFEGRRIFEDSGVFEYEEGLRRAWSRGTRAHNTVSVDDLDQAQFWKSFRVGKRGYPRDLALTADAITCSHDGFIRQGTPVLHERQLRFLSSGFVVRDRLSRNGSGTHRYRASYHCSPATSIRQLSATRFLLNDRLTVHIQNADASVETSEFYPEYGKVQKRPCLVLQGSFQSHAEFSLTCTSSS